MEGEEEGEGEGEEGEGREEGGVGRTESFDGLTYGLIWLIPTVSTEVSEELKAKKGLVAKVLVYSFACFVLWYLYRTAIDTISAFIRSLESERQKCSIASIPDLNQTTKQRFLTYISKSLTQLPSPLKHQVNVS